MSNPLPFVIEAELCYVKPIVITNFVKNLDQIDNAYSFLKNANTYADYYKKNEHGKKKHIKEILKLGKLSPLPKYHAMHSYWKTFRRRIEFENSYGNKINELFYLLPLEIVIPITAIGANGRHHKAKARVYLFPFGCCVINLNIKIKWDKYLPLDEFVDSILFFNKSNLSIKKCKGSDDMGSFNHFSSKIVNLIKNSLFDDPSEINVSAFPSHKILFIKNTSEDLNETIDNHIIAFIAAATGHKFNDIVCKSSEYITRSFDREKFLLTKEKPGEILFFTPNGSVFYTSPNWNVKIPD